MEIKINKKNLIIAGCVVLFCIALFCSGFLCGRNRRISDISNSGTETTELAKQLEQKNTELIRELEQKITECEGFERRLNTIGSELTDSLGVVRQMRGDLDIATIESQDALGYIRELRRRFDLCEQRNRELESRLIELQESTIKQ